MRVKFLNTITLVAVVILFSIFTITRLRTVENYDGEADQRKPIEFVDTFTIPTVEKKEISNWATYRNKLLGFQIQYPQEKVIVYSESDGMVVFTLPEYNNKSQHLLPIGLQISDRGIGSALDAIYKETIIQNDITPEIVINKYRLNNYTAYQKVMNVQSYSYDFYIEPEDEINSALRILTFNDFPDITNEEKKESLYYFNMMVSTFEYLE